MELRDLQETAELARLNMGEAELRGAFSAFEEMLSFFAAMQQGAFSPPLIGGKAQAGADDFTAAESNIPAGMAAYASLVDSGWFRSGGASGNSPDGLSRQLLSKSGERDGRFIVIPNVL
jgi:aspartyl-tRNA(Asn)/glutamyl-tRNA(Gln) amidotransferase subunit C